MVALSVPANYGAKKCTCSHMACETFKEAFYYLYPFNIEYSLFASAMTYIMWKNVGRIVEHHKHYKFNFYVKDVFVGPVAGLLLVVAGLVTFVLYKINILKEDKEKRNKALLIHFIMNIVIVSLMSLSTMIGCIIYRLDRREYVSDKNPTRSLDVGLLVASSLGQFIISYFSLVATVAMGAQGYLNVLNLAWAVVLVVEIGLQNYFIIEGLHREPINVMQANARAFHDHTEMANDVEGQISRCSISKKPSWKRRVLREVCAFLLLANIIVSCICAYWTIYSCNNYQCFLSKCA